MHRLRLLFAAGLVAGCGPTGYGSYFHPSDGGGEDLGAGADDASLGDDAAVPPDGGPGCGLQTCAKMGAECGMIGDGCGGAIDCGTCVAPQSCGGGGVLFHCGGMNGCTPSDCKTLGVGCGMAGDGCGGLLDCGKCGPGLVCGGGGFGMCGPAGTPGDAGVCIPRTCGQAKIGCGPTSDGCGGMLACGTCPQGQSCGGGGVPSQCGGMPCVPLTCKTAGANCGPVGDGCGGMLACGNCALPDICGGGGIASVCGGGNTDGGVPCVGLCKQQMACMNGGTTTISGTVVAPTPPQFGNPDPLYNAVVYIPNAAVVAFKPGVSCDKCGADVSGAPLVTFTTGPDGTFVLKNAPCGANIPLVIQLGRWRRHIVIPNVACCMPNQLSLDQTRLPRTQNEGGDPLNNIPLTAMVTGNVDALECVLRKVGIDDSEFTVPSANGGKGRVQFYLSHDSVFDINFGLIDGMGADVAGGAPAESQLWGNPAELAKFDMALFACEGYPFGEKASSQKNLIDYTSQGGRVFATHYSYEWLYNDPPFSNTGNWGNVDQNPPNDPLTGLIDQTFPKGVAFAKWLSLVGASPQPGQVQIHSPRHDLDGVNAPAQRWIYSNNPSTIQHYTFNTPVNANPDNQCGRVLFSDFHVTNLVDPNFGNEGLVFPQECLPGPMTAQEKVLEFMLFDLSSCIQPDHAPPPMCTPRTCQDAKANCGPVGDGCGALIDCGPCPMGQVCGGGGVPSQCGGMKCQQLTCQQQGFNCGPAGDGCGALIDCGKCPPGQVCGGNNMPGQCAAVDGGACTPKSCKAQGLLCGPTGDGCGMLLDCGPCPPGQSCGGGGKPGVCGGSMCKPRTCADAGANCGLIGDGCGGTVDCGKCTPPQTCGGGGIANQCGNLG